MGTLSILHVVAECPCTHKATIPLYLLILDLLSLLKHTLLYSRLSGRCCYVNLHLLSMAIRSCVLDTAHKATSGSRKSITTTSTVSLLLLQECSCRWQFQHVGLCEGQSFLLT